MRSLTTGITDYIRGLRCIISYLAKQEQKYDMNIYGSSEVPPPSGLGRPRELISEVFYVGKVYPCLCSKLLQQKPLMLEAGSKSILLTAPVLYP